MGLFTNRCVNRECDYRVRKGSQFCPKCGAVGPKGLTQCGSCAAEVARTSKFCWRCGADLSQVAKPTLLNDRWSRRDGDFAVRVDNQDVKGWLAKPLVIDHGTRALLFQAGRFRAELPAGRHDMGGFLNRLNHFMIDQDASVVLIDAGDVTIDLENGGLWTADKIEVGSVERLVFRIADMDALYVNLFKGRNVLTVAEMEQQLADEVQMLLAGIAGRHPAERLFTDPAIRARIEEDLRQAVAPTLRRMGLELVQIRFVSFAGEAYERIRRREADLADKQRSAGFADREADVTEQRTRLAQRLRETFSTDKMHEFKTGKDLEQFIRQTEHELGLREVIRGDEMARLAARLEFERGREGILRRIEIETLQDGAERAKQWEALLHDERRQDERQMRGLQRRLDAAKGEAEQGKVRLEMGRLEHGEKLRQEEAEHALKKKVEWDEFARDKAEAELGQRLLRETVAVEQDALDREQKREAARLEALSKSTSRAIMAIVDGPAAERIVELERVRAQQNMTPDQILALAAAASPEAARALTQKYRDEGAISGERAAALEKQLADQKQMADSHADRMERLMKTSLEQVVAAVTAAAAGRRAAPQPMVVAGLAGTPVVIGAGARCRHCGAALESGGGFCPACGKRQ